MKRGCEDRMYGTDERATVKKGVEKYRISKNKTKAEM
jgi:hypothetical protein